MGHAHSTSHSSGTAYTDRQQYYENHARHTSRTASRSTSEMVLNGNARSRSGSLSATSTSYAVPPERPRLQRAVSSMNASMTRPDLAAPSVQKVMKPIELVQMLQGMGFTAQAIEECMSELRLAGRRTVIDANALIETLLQREGSMIRSSSNLRGSTLTSSKTPVPFHDSGVGDGPLSSTSSSQMPIAQPQAYVSAPLPPPYLVNSNTNPFTQIPASTFTTTAPLPPTQALPPRAPQAQPMLRNPASQAEVDSIQRYLNSLVQGVDREVQGTLVNSNAYVANQLPIGMLSPGRPKSHSISSLEAVDKTCRICMDRPIQTVILRCGHLALCVECSKGLDKCPICRNEITEIVRIYQA